MDRNLTHAKMHAALTALDDAALQHLFDEALETTSGWGTNHIIELDGQKLFVKRVPLTELESQHPYSTSNHFNLPTYYNYGVGSAGFGAFRELATHLKTTEWVLQGACPHFPLLHHHCIRPRTTERRPFNQGRFDRYIEYWNGDENIAAYALKRWDAPYELVLFLEYFPHTLEDWFRHNADKTKDIVAQMGRTIQFMRQNRVIHFDGGFSNILTDGHSVYLTDFGLSLDAEFSLNEDEQKLFEQNRYYDDALFLINLSVYIRLAFEALSTHQKQALAEKYGINGESLTNHDRTILRQNLAELRDNGMLVLEADFVTTIEAYGEVIALIQLFLNDMFENNRKDYTYDYARLAELLEAKPLLVG